MLNHEKNCCWSRSGSHWMCHCDWYIIMWNKFTSIPHIYTSPLTFSPNCSQSIGIWISLLIDVILCQIHFALPTHLLSRPFAIRHSYLEYTQISKKNTNPIILTLLLAPFFILKLNSPFDIKTQQNNFFWIITIWKFWNIIQFLVLINKDKVI